MPRAALALLVCGTVACAYDRDVLYEVAAGRASPLLPFVPDAERIDACAACAEQSCASEREACVADPTCAALLDCRRRCSDPACLAKCGERTHWDLERVGFPQDVLFDTYERCVSLLACGGACGWGKNWGCRGRYSWPEAEGPGDLPLALEVRLSDNVGHVARVAACGDHLCSIVLDEGESDAWGQVELDVGALSRLEFLRIDFGDAKVDFYTLPVFRATTIHLAASAQFVPESAAFLGPDALEFADPKGAIIAVLTLDCAGAPAPAVQFELIGEAPDKRAFYAAGSGNYPFFTATETSSSGRGGFVGVPDGTFGLRARSLTGERLASRDTLPAAAGTWTIIGLFPDVTVGE